jgi:diadenosine tetraphosphate (Ap4A) HIT family hydrolase
VIAHEITTLPSGIRVAAGGTRNAINLNRPWQVDILVNPAECPFETREQEEVAHFDIGEGWRVIENLYTPFPFHRLIIPRSCWSAQEVRSLGGEGRIVEAFQVVRSLLEDERHELWLGVHVGASAGQNIGHLHYHLLQPLERASGLVMMGDNLEYSGPSSPTILQDAAFTVVAAGCRAGQCMILPRDGPKYLSPNTVIELAHVLSEVITLYSVKFLSVQGLPPDYSICIVFKGPHIIRGSFVPILNNWGFTEYLGLLEGTPLVLPWSHEAAARFLTE